MAPRSCQIFSGANPFVSGTKKKTKAVPKILNAENSQKVGPVPRPETIFVKNFVMKNERTQFVVIATPAFTPVNYIVIKLNNFKKIKTYRQHLEQRLH